MRGVEGLWGVWRVCGQCGGSVRGVEGLSMRLVLCFCNTGTVQCRTGWTVVGFTSDSVQCLVLQATPFTDRGRIWSH